MKFIESGEAGASSPETAEALIFAADRGTARWWDEIAARPPPAIERIGHGRVRVTFLYRDDREDTDRVYIDLNGITDHHSTHPQSLQRIAGTDVWMWQVELPSGWRGSYSFIPATAADAPPLPDSNGAASKLRQRAWWSRIAAHAESDPLNPCRKYPSGWGGEASPLHLPDAPDQSGWRPVDFAGREFPAPRSFEWHSARQGKRRTVWHFRTGDQSAPTPVGGLPLIVLLDGGNWVHRMPVAPVLELETAAGRLPPAFYFLLDSIDGFHRAEDLTPNPLFWSAIRDELLPLAREIAPITSDPARCIVAGQSFGGLAALHAGLAYPDQWGGVLAQSPSLWWPDDSLPRGRMRRPGADGELTRQLRAGTFPPGHARVFMEVGTREEVMIDVALTMREALHAAGHETTYREYEGGHDALCWRGGLIDGLRWLLADPLVTQHKESPR